jgi:deazaflavin-dependent oxidoreductase (nitroreductase family)
MLLKLMMSPLGFKFDRFMVRWTGDSPLSRLFARQGGYQDPRMPLLLVAKGRKSGKNRATVLSFFEIDGKLLVVGSAGGSPIEPQWVGNLRANPDATIYIARKPRRVRARIAAGDERRSLWEALVASVPTYAGFQAGVAREIPLVILD